MRTRGTSCLRPKTIIGAGPIHEICQDGQELMSVCAAMPEGRSPMSTNTAILDTEPTSYWPLTDDSGMTCHDEMELHDAVVNGEGVKLAVIPFGDASAPFFDG